MKSFRSRGIITSISLNKELFNQYYLCTPRGMKVGRLIDKFFVYGSDNVMFVVSTMNTVQAEWHLPSKKPKKWKIAYNDINEVLTRLEKTDLALQKIKMLTVGSNYK